MDTVPFSWKKRVDTIASEPFTIMEITRKLREFERELDNVDYDRPIDENRAESKTSGYGDVYMINLGLRKQEGDHTIHGEDKGEKYSIEDYKPGDTAALAPGTYLHIVTVHPVYMEDGLFGFTYPTGTLSVYIRGDLKGEALRRVVRHEVAHHALLASEEQARSMTGTQMKDFLSIYNGMRLRNY